MSSWIARGALLTAAIGLTTVGQAEDPTAPPPGFAVQREAPATTRQVDPDGFSVTYVLLGADRRLALVNDQLVGEGDRVNGARVAEIRSDAVMLIAGDQRLRLQVSDQSIRKRNIRVEGR